MAHGLAAPPARLVRTDSLVAELDFAPPENTLTGYDPH